jgi:MFS family permease
VTVHRPGSPRAALAHSAFRWVFVGTFASNIGTWMQNVALLAFADQLSHKASYVGLVTLAQLGPILLLSPFGGAIADVVNRKTIMIAAATIQMALSVALAVVAAADHPSKSAVVLCVLGIGIASSANAPAAAATLPALVGRTDLAGAVALNSAQMNAARVVGPLLAVLPFLHRPANVFAVNAATYLFVIAALLVVDFDGRPQGGHAETPLGRLIGGFRAAHGDVVIRRALVTVSVYSLCSLAYIYQMKGFARTNLHLPDGRFGLLFSCFGMGAAIGAVAVGTTLAHLTRTLVTRVGLAGFSLALAVFGLLHDPTPAYFVVALSGFFYFLVITSLSTVLQEAVSDDVRGRVMGLWMMGWAGLVPVGSLIAGVVIDGVGHTPVMLFGAAVALALTAYARLDTAGATAPAATRTPAPANDDR